jgi:hypothetical protein
MWEAMEHLRKAPGTVTELGSRPWEEPTVPVTFTQAHAVGQPFGIERMNMPPFYLAYPFPSLMTALFLPLVSSTTVSDRSSLLCSSLEGLRTDYLLSQ